MKNKKIIVLVIIFIVILIATVACFKLLNGKTGSNNDDIDIVVTTTLEERKMWSEFLKKNPYISQINIDSIEFLDDTDIIKAAISSQEVETEYIVTEEIEKTPILSLGEGYKKSIININEYAKKIFNRENIEYNFVETYVEGEEYLVIDENYIYFTKIQLPEKEYILISLEKNGNNFVAKIYEYEVNENNRTQIEEMLNTGKINKNIEMSKEYTITGTTSNEDICILTKT